MDNHQEINNAYQAALDRLYGLINFEMRRKDRYMANKLDATRPARLMGILEDPHQQYPTIHIAGTKGKGSVAAMCASCLSAAGYSVGLYTSPHVIEFRERIRILTPTDRDGRIARSDFVTYMQEMEAALSQAPGVTWFEVVTAIAFLHFARKEVDVAVVEVGLGGRLDATNVLTPLVSAITSLSLDHTDLLGHTLAQIAGEKGGIIKAGVPVVSASQAPEAMQRLTEIAQTKNAPLSVVGRNWRYDGGRRDQPIGKQELIICHSPDPEFIPQDTAFTLALSGAHQLENATLALAALHAAQPYLPQLDIRHLREGLASVQWIGRLQRLETGENMPAVLVDCAHNPDSAAKLRHALLHEYEYRRLWLVLGATEGKDVDGIMQQLLPLSDTAFATASSHPRALAPAVLQSRAAALGVEMEISAEVEEAFLRAWACASPGDLICVTGSIFVVGDLLNQWERIQSQLSRVFVVV